SRTGQTRAASVSFTWECATSIPRAIWPTGPPVFGAGSARVAGEPARAVATAPAVSGATTMTGTAPPDQAASTRRRTLGCPSAWAWAACASSAPARQSAVPAPRASSPVARTQDPPAALAPRSNSQPGLNGVRGWTLLGLGDSIPGAAYCAGCTSFVQLYSNRIQADTGTPVKALNLADNSGIDSARLLSAVRGDPAVRSAVRRAD